jgi:hypothetical protein
VHVHVCITIDVPPPQVWAGIENVERHVDWMRDAESIRFRSDQHAGVGTEFDCVTKVGPLRTTDRMVVTEWTPVAAMGIEHHGLVTGAGRFTLRPSDGGTEFCWDEELTFPLRMGGRAGEVVARPVLQRIWRSNLERLKQEIERA